MRAFLKIVPLFLSLCLFTGVPGQAVAQSEERVIGTLVAVPGLTEETFPIDPSWGSLESLNVVVFNGVESPLDRANKTPKEKHADPPRAIFDLSPKTRVSSATVTFNGEKIFKPQDFNAQVVTLSKTFSDLDPEMSEVALSAFVEGDKDSSMTVRVTGFFEVDERVPVTWYFDLDGDGYGGTTLRPPIEGYLDSPPGTLWVTLDGDCNERNPYVYPGTPTCP